MGSPRWDPVRLIVTLFLGLSIAGFSRPVFSKKQTTAPIAFENRQVQSGIRFVLNNGTTEEKPIIDSVLGGVALLDYDNDGFLDVFFTNGARIPTLAKDDASFQNQLYRNNHDGTFADVTAKAGVAGEGYSMGVAAADYDNDGFGDLYVTGVNRNILYHNNGDGTFSDVTVRARVSGTDPAGRKLWSVGAAWVDYDHDGRLDLFVSNYLDWSFSNNRVCGEPGKRLSCAPGFYKGQPNLLYRNNGDGTFTDVSESAGISGHIGKGMSVAIADYDHDGFEDILVANDNERNFLFRNVGGRKFQELGVEASVAFTEDGVPVSSMGVDFRDLDNDGQPDAVITALEDETFQLFRNDGHGFFNASAYSAGLAFASIRMSGWAVGGYDFDNDGYKDLFTANSHVSENAGIDGLHRYKQPNAIFQNLRNGTFKDITQAAGVGLQAAAAHRGAGFGDLNNDGSIDVVVSAIAGPAEVLYSRATTGNHWILLQLEGRQSNRDGIGARIRVTGESGSVQYNHVTTSVGYASASDKRVHFGLGGDRRIREIEIRWPSGKVQLLRDISADRILKVPEA